MKKLALLALSASLAACATTNTDSNSAASASSKDWTAPKGADNRVPFASTYSRYPGRPTALVGATVFDGTGRRIDNGTVLFRDGEVVAVGDASLPTEGYDRVDASGKFVTPGVIMLMGAFGVSRMMHRHSYLGSRWIRNLCSHCSIDWKMSIRGQYVALDNGDIDRRERQTRIACQDQFELARGDSECIKRFLCVLFFESGDRLLRLV